MVNDGNYYYQDENANTIDIKFHIFRSLTLTSQPTESENIFQQEGTGALCTSIPNFKSSQ